MSVRKVETTEIYASWGNEIDKARLDQLNKDFETMGINLKAFYEAGPDSWTLKFVKEWNEE